MQIEYVAPSQLKPHPRNYRRHPEEQLRHIERSLRDHGFYKNVVVAKDDTILAGHGTVQVATAIGFDFVPVVRLQIDPDSRAALKVLAGDNEIASLADVDDHALARLLQDVGVELVGTGFDDVGLERLLRQIGRREVQEDHVPPVRETIIQRGDLFQLGHNRIMCGDSTNTTDVELLFGSDLAQLIATDPPYGVAYGDETGTGSTTIANDENDGPKLQRFLEAVFAAWTPHLIDNAAWYLWHAQMTQGFFAAAAAAAAAAQVLIHRQIVWVKPSLVLGHGDYHWRHELCFYGWRRGHRPKWYGDRKQDTVWEIGRENDGVHPTQKPVELFARSIRLSSGPGAVVAEPFSGSGTQIIAAEQLGRRCYAMELEPKYVRVAIDRWERLTGNRAIKVK